VFPSIVCTRPPPSTFSTTPTWSMAPIELLRPQSKNTMSPGLALFTLATVPGYQRPILWKSWACQTV